MTRGVANNTNLLIADKKKLGDKIKLDKKKTSSGYHKNCICKKRVTSTIRRKPRLVLQELRLDKSWMERRVMRGHFPLFLVDNETRVV